MSVAEGTTVGVIGPNGAGKTTLFNAITGIVGVDGGSVRFAGDDVTGLEPYRRAQLGMARSFQNLGLMLTESVETNIMASLHLSADYGVLDPLLRPRATRRIEQHCMGRAVDVMVRFELMAYRHTAVADLSFGVARMVELAGLFAREARILLLDEPTTGLDTSELATLLEVLSTARNDGHTSVVIAHDVGFIIELCDVVYVLAEGRVIYSGGPQEVRSDQRVVDSYLGRAS